MSASMLGRASLWRSRSRLLSTTAMMLPASPEAATRFLKFINTSPTPFHAVQNASVHLEKAGFHKVLLV